MNQSKYPWLIDGITSLILIGTIGLLLSEVLRNRLEVNYLTWDMEQTTDQIREVLDVIGSNTMMEKQMVSGMVPNKTTTDRTAEPRLKTLEARLTALENLQTRVKSENDALRARVAKAEESTPWRERLLMGALLTLVVSFVLKFFRLQRS